MKDCLYKTILIRDWNPCHVVYRDLGGEWVDKEACAKVHRVALFVSMDEAEQYCAYRNEMTQKYGTDDISVIAAPLSKEENDKLNEQSNRN